MNKAKIVAFAALMAALSNILSVPPFAIPITIGASPSRIHFSQIPILLAGILAGPWAGLLAGVVGGVYMSLTTIPFIIGGLAILGASSGILSRKLNLRPFFSSILAWAIQIPYVLISDYIWFVSFRLILPSGALTTIGVLMVKLTIEAVIASALAEILVLTIRRYRITL